MEVDDARRQDHGLQHWRCLRLRLVQLGRACTATSQHKTTQSNKAHQPQHNHSTQYNTAQQQYSNRTATAQHSSSIAAAQQQHSSSTTTAQQQHNNSTAAAQQYSNSKAIAQQQHSKRPATQKYKMLHRDEPKQNLSGHVTFNVPQAHFYREVHNRTKKLELRRRLGLVSNERVRNPMMAERSPRNDFSGFVYKPPPAQPKAERWEYPENDWGLMAKFQSQQPVYRDIFQKEREYSTRMDELHKIKEDNTRVIEREVSKQKQIHVEVQQRREANADAKLHCSQPGYVHPHARVKVHHKASAKTFAPDDLDASLRSDRLRDQVRRQQHMQRLHGHHMGDCAATPPPVTDFYGTAISQFKIIGQTQPEVLREWRAHRAAQFLSKNGPSQCTPPPPAQPHAVVFRPGKGEIGEGIVGVRCCPIIGDSLSWVIGLHTQLCHLDPDSIIVPYSPFPQPLVPPYTALLFPCTPAPLSPSSP
ncbi:hypothetical protein B484DRAFT_481116, partial [Ochromonadaceae sp. CCMP2298]